jgi:hypothetical protein
LKARVSLAVIMAVGINTDGRRPARHPDLRWLLDELVFAYALITSAASTHLCSAIRVVLEELGYLPPTSRLGPRPVASR